MPRKTRKSGKKLSPFNFNVLKEIMSFKKEKCNNWQDDYGQDCSDADFFLGKERVFNKYRSLFPDKYKEYIESSYSRLKQSVPMFPSKNCNQIVFGTGEDIVLYIAINNKYLDAGYEAPFTLFMPKVWNTETNLLFTQCAIKHKINTCDNSFFIRILLPKKYNRLLDKDGNARVTLLEICTIYKVVKELGLTSFIYKTAAEFDYDIIFI